MFTALTLTPDRNEVYGDSDVLARDMSQRHLVGLHLFGTPAGLYRSFFSVFVLYYVKTHNSMRLNLLREPTKSEISPEGLQVLPQYAVTHKGKSDPQ